MRQIEFNFIIGSLCFVLIQEAELIGFHNLFQEKLPNGKFQNLGHFSQSHDITILIYQEE